MRLTFHDQETAEQQAADFLYDNEDGHTVTDSVRIREDAPVQDLATAAITLLPHANFIGNVSITNKHAEWERFRDAYDAGNQYDPGFSFEPVGWDEERFTTLLQALRDATRHIDTAVLDRYQVKQLSVHEVRTLFTDIFREFTDYVRLAAHIEDRHEWQAASNRLWPMVPDHVVTDAEQALQDGFAVDEQEQDLEASDLKPMWEEELDRLGVEWTVEVRDVPGCYNIPEERTVVVADGGEEKRYYSREEAMLLQKHELFHVVRAYNGITAGEHVDFPPLLGIHTPYYDKTEEGGAVYREYATGTHTTSQDKDYHLRLVAAHYLSRGEDIPRVVERLVDLGADVKRAFFLAARNREAIRHHIYLGGYREEWADRDEYWPLLLGKINTRYADLLKKEVTAGGMLRRPRVGPEELFRTD